jgi:hypothetical protein
VIFRLSIGHVPAEQPPVPSGAAIVLGLHFGRGDVKVGAAIGEIDSLRVLPGEFQAKP